MVLPRGGRRKAGQATGRGAAGVLQDPRGPAAFPSQLWAPGPRTEPSGLRGGSYISVFSGRGRKCRARVQQRGNKQKSGERSGHKPGGGWVYAGPSLLQSARKSSEPGTASLAWHEHLCLGTLKSGAYQGTPELIPTPRHSRHCPAKKVPTRCQASWQGREQAS